MGRGFGLKFIVILALGIAIAVAALPAPAQGQAAGGLVEAELLLNDPRPCIPATGQRACDAGREALWNGESAAWAARGVVDGDARFRETVIFRVRAGDPAAIAAIARILGAPYLKITRIQFAGGEVVEITNLGGGPQDLTGWSLRSPTTGVRVNLPVGVVLRPGGKCSISTALPQANQGGECRAFSGTVSNDGVWPDDAGRVVLYYDALDLPGDDTSYSADPAGQPPPPNLQVVRPFLQPTEIEPALAREINDSIDFLVRGIGLPSRPYLGDCQVVRPAVSGTYCTLVRSLSQAGDVVRVSIVPAGDVIFVRRAGRWSPITATFPGGA